MTQLVHLDREALRDFAKRMKSIADDLDEVYDHTSQVCAGDDATTVKRQHGVQIGLGTVRYAHRAHYNAAGELMARRVSEGLTFATGLAAEVRELSELATEVERALDATDSITADALQRIADGLANLSDGGGLLV